MLRISKLLIRVGLRKYTTTADKVVGSIQVRRVRGSDDIMGEKCPVTNIVDGNGIMVWYKEDGTEWFRRIYKDGNSVNKTIPTPTAPPP